MDNKELKDIINKLKLFNQIVNIDTYINDYLYILSLKYKKNEYKSLEIDNYYLSLFDRIIKDKKDNICIITQRYLTNYNYLIVPNINLDYFIDTYGSITIGYLYYIIYYWDNLKSNLFFLNHQIDIVNNHCIFPLSLYLIPKSKIEILINNHQKINLNYDKNELLLDKNDKQRIKNKISSINFKEWWIENLLDIPYPDFYIEYCPELTFSISNKIIHKKNKDYYTHIFRNLTKKPFSKDIIYFEKCFQYIFM